MPADNVAGVSHFYVIKLFTKYMLPGGAPCSLWGRGSRPPIAEFIALISQNRGPVVNNSCRRQKRVQRSTLAGFRAVLHGDDRYNKKPCDQNESDDAEPASAMSRWR